MSRLGLRPGQSSTNASFEGSLTWLRWWWWWWTQAKVSFARWHIITEVLIQTAQRRHDPFRTERFWSFPGSNVTMTFCGVLFAVHNLSASVCHYIPCRTIILPYCVVLLPRTLCVSPHPRWHWTWALYCNLLTCPHHYLRCPPVVNAATLPYSNSRNFRAL